MSQTPLTAVPSQPSSAPDTTAPVVVRELTVDDADHVVDLFTSLSDRDRYFRFFRPMPTYPPAVLRVLTAMDGLDHIAVGAFVDGTCVGVARYIRSTRRPTSAEVAVTVSSEVRGRGVAKRMIRVLDEIGGSRGVEEFEIMVHPENRAASALFRSLGYTTRFEDGCVVGSCPVGTAGARPLELAQAA